MGSEIFCLIQGLDCKTVRFFPKISKEFGNAWRKSLTRAKRASLTRPTGVRIFSVSPQSRSLFSDSFQTFCLTARLYLNTQKYVLFRSLTGLAFEGFRRYSRGQTSPGCPPQDSTNLSQLFRSSRAAIRNKWHLYFPLDSWDWTLTPKGKSKKKSDESLKRERSVLKCLRPRNLPGLRNWRETRLRFSSLAISKLNPLNPNIKIQILICCPYMFSIEAAGRICWSINEIHLVWSGPQFSWPWCFIKQR